MVMVLALIVAGSLCAQPVFLDKTRSHKYRIPTRSVLPGGAADINGDLTDDLLILDKGNLLKVIISSGKNMELSIVDSIKTGTNREWTLTVGDLDNNGVQEIITAGEYNAASVISFIDGKLQRKLVAAGIYAQGSNTADINNDGWLDYYLCNDIGPNRIYLNDKSGNLNPSALVNFLLNDPTDGSGNYGSEWTDVNNDLLPDLYISKCRAGVSNPADPRRINRLYINKGNGAMTDEAARYHLDIGAQSWTSTFGDLDNDGDQDVFVVNHYEPHQMLRNDGDAGFVRVDQPGLPQTFSFQVLMRDFDNDGRLDVLLTGVEGSVYLQNKGNWEFSVHRDITGAGSVRSCVAGDFNDDGFTDIHAHMGEPINDVGFTNDQLWINQPNGNHYIKVNLAGAASNRSGIGARLELYGPWGRQVRYVKGGESYGIFSSLQQIFGMGPHEAADSLVVYWPSGGKDKYSSGLTSGSTLLAQEGRCMTTTLAIADSVLLYSNVPVTINAPAGYTSYLWNDGQTTASVQKGPGSWFVRMTDAAGCVTISKPAEVRSGCFEEGAKLNQADRVVKSCSNAVIELTSVPAAGYFWSTGDTGQSISAYEDATLVLTATDFCNRTLTDTVSVRFFAVLPVVTGDTVKRGESAMVTSSHADTKWYADGDDGILVGTGDTLVTGPLDTTTVFLAIANEVIDKKSGKCGIGDFPVANQYGANSTLGHLTFNVERKCVIRSVLVNTDTEGGRRIVILNKAKDTIFGKDVYLKPGITRVMLDVELSPGNQYIMATDENINMANLGFRSPRLVRTYLGTAYPYTVRDIVTISSSSLGPTYYFYFYDWEVDYDMVSCASDPIPVTVVVDRSTGIEEWTRAGIRIFPNPVSDEITVSSEGGSAIKGYMLSDLSGRQVMATEIRPDVQVKISMGTMASGTYILAIISDDGSRHYRKIVVQ